MSRKDEYISVPIRRKDLGRILDGDVPLHVLNTIEAFTREPHPFRPGVYQHYKGGLYRALGLARHTEMDVECVVYVSLADGRMWLRPYDAEGEPSWIDPLIKIDTNDVSVPTGQQRRFDFVRD